MEDTVMRGSSNSPRASPSSTASMFPREELYTRFARLSLTAEPINHLLSHWAEDSKLAEQLAATVRCKLSTALVAQLGVLLTAPRRQETNVHREEMIVAHVHNWVVDRSLSFLPTDELDVIAAVLIRAMAPEFNWNLIRPRCPEVARK